MSDLDPEVKAMDIAYKVISARPPTEHERILKWLTERIESDAAKVRGRTNQDDRRRVVIARVADDDVKP